jgi:hypothetical protein
MYILGVELTQGVDLPAPDEGGGLRALAGHHDIHVLIRIESGRRHLRA